MYDIIKMVRVTHSLQDARQNMVFRPLMPIFLTVLKNNYSCLKESFLLEVNHCEVGTQCHITTGYA